MKRIDVKNIIPRSTLKVSPIWSNKFIIFLSAIGSETADKSLYETVKIVSFIIGKIHIPIIITKPRIPTEFLSSDAQPKTESTESPNALPTTGTTFETVAFIPFAAKPSTLLVKFPSKDITVVKIVITAPRTQIIPDLNNLLNFPICTLSDKFETIDIAVEINKIGRITLVIAFPINTIIRIIIGSSIELVATFPTYSN